MIGDSVKTDPGTSQAVTEILDNWVPPVLIELNIHEPPVPSGMMREVCDKLRSRFPRNDQRLPGALGTDEFTARFQARYVRPAAPRRAEPPPTPAAPPAAPAATAPLPASMPEPAPPSPAAPPPGPDAGVGRAEAEAASPTTAAAVPPQAAPRDPTPRASWMRAVCERHKVARLDGLALADLRAEVDGITDPEVREWAAKLVEAREASEALAKGEPRAAARAAATPDPNAPTAATVRRVTRGAALSPAVEQDVAARIKKEVVRERIRDAAREHVKRERPAPEITLTSAEDVPDEKLRTVFGGRLIQGAFQLMVGPGEAGKGMVSTDIIAKLTTVAPFPGEDPQARRDPMTVLVCVTEDSASMFKWRLRAAGANLSMVKFVTGPPTPRGGMVIPSPIAFDDDAGELVKKAKEVGAGALFLETTLEHLGDRERKQQRSTNTEADVRHALGPIIAVCREAELIGWGIIHPRKSTDGGIEDSISGSAAFRNVSRGVMNVYRDPMDPDPKSPWRLLMTSKANYLPHRPPTLRFRIEPWERDSDYGRVVWPTAEQGLVDPRSAEDIWGEIQDRNKKRRDFATMDAEEFLKEVLANGAVLTVAEIEKEAKERGINMAAVHRAKGNLKVESRKKAFAGPWGWALPQGAGRAPEQLDL